MAVESRPLITLSRPQRDRHCQSGTGLNWRTSQTCTNKTRSNRRSWPSGDGVPGAVSMAAPGVSENYVPGQWRQIAEVSAALSARATAPVAIGFDILAVPSLVASRDFADRPTRLRGGRLMVSLARHGNAIWHLPAIRGAIAALRLGVAGCGRARAEQQRSADDGDNWNRLHFGISSRAFLPANTVSR